MSHSDGNVSQALLAKLRAELFISNEQHVLFMSDLLNQKKLGILTPSSSPPVAPPTFDMTTAAAAKSHNMAAHSQQQHQPRAIAPPQRKRPPSSSAEQEGRKDEKRIKMADLRSNASLANPEGLNPDLIGKKVSRFWAQSQSWFSGVITDFKPSKSQYCVTYDLGTNKESGELLNLDIAIGAGELKLLQESLDLASFPHSRAVQSSTILNMWRKETKRQMQAQEGGGDQPGRRNVIMMSDSDDE